MNDRRRLDLQLDVARECTGPSGTEFSRARDDFESAVDVEAPPEALVAPKASLALARVGLCEAVSSGQEVDFENVVDRLTGVIFGLGSGEEPGYATRRLLSEAHAVRALAHRLYPFLDDGDPEADLRRAIELAVRPDRQASFERELAGELFESQQEARAVEALEAAVRSYEEHLEALATSPAATAVAQQIDEVERSLTLASDGRHPCLR